MTPKRIELITRDWSEIEDILEKSMINFQNEEWGGPWGTPRGPQRTKNDQILTFLGFCHHPSHSGRIFLLLLRWLNARRVAENEKWEWRPLGAQQGGPKGPKIAEIDQNHEFFLFYGRSGIFLMIGLFWWFRHLSGMFEAWHFPRWVKKTCCIHLWCTPTCLRDTGMSRQLLLLIPLGILVEFCITLFKEYYCLKTDDIKVCQIHRFH